MANAANNYSVVFFLLGMLFGSGNAVIHLSKDPALLVAGIALLTAGSLGSMGLMALHTIRKIKE